jgi:hypothetical protein
MISEKQLLLNEIAELNKQLYSAYARIKYLQEEIKFNGVTDREAEHTRE